MQPTLRQLLESVAAGALSPADAERTLQSSGLADLGFAQVDLDRLRRRGRPEAIFAEGKTPEQVAAIAQALVAAGQNALATRTTPEQRDALAVAFHGQGWTLRRNDTARTVLVETTPPAPKKGLVGIVCAGTTDLPVAEEAAETARALGSPVELIADVGVACLHRVLRAQPRLARFRVLVVVAGMEGALPSVVAGLVSAPVIAVPTDVGYGASFQGVAALLGMLNSCSPGISVVNIGNGYGAGYLADVINGLGEAGNAPADA